MTSALVRAFRLLFWIRSPVLIMVGSLVACKEATRPPTVEVEITFASNGVLYVTDTSGTPPERVVPQDESSYEPTWSPDGRYVAFTRQTQTSPSSWDYQVTVLDTETGVETPLSVGPRDNFSPAWSPNGQQIAFLSRSKDSTNGATIRIIQSTGTGTRELGTAHYYVRAPRWAPDGTRLAVTDSAVEVAIVDANTGALVKVLSPGFSPAWSPDGSTIAFVCSGQSAAAICLIDVDGQNQRVISDSSDYQPAWSPDGTYLAVESWRRPFNQSPDADVYLMRADGTGQKQLTLGVTWDREPAWRRFLTP